MKSMRQRLDDGDITLLDGAMGSLLMQRGLASGEAPESWNLTRTEDLAAVASAYAEAGADVVLTNTFGASPIRLAEFGLKDQVETINRAAVEVARTGANGRALVAGSMGPCGKILAPYGDAEPDDVRRSFHQQARALVESDVDLLCIETMTDLAEARLAVEAARAASPDIVITAAMTFEPTDRGWFTIMGNDVESAVAGLIEVGADVLGSNCGQGSSGMREVAREFSRHTDLPILIQANAGLPELQDMNVIYPESPGEMAASVKELLATGVRLVGGCCGTTPTHIAQLRRAIDAFIAGTE